MKLLEGASERAGSRKRSGKSQRFLVRFSLLEGLLLYGGEFTLIYPVGLVKPFPQTRIKNDGSPSALLCRSQFVFYIFWEFRNFSGRIGPESNCLSFLP